MAKAKKQVPEEATKKEPKEDSHYDRAPRQKNSDRNPVKAAEETRDVPNQHGAIK